MLEAHSMVRWLLSGMDLKDFRDVYLGLGSGSE